MVDNAAALAVWLGRIEAMHPTEVELGLDRLRQVARRLDVTSLPAPVVMVAGTNGKGSTLRLMRALAEGQGRRVCLYTSPHLHRFNERIRLPEGLASDAQLCAAFEEIEQARGQVSLTYFEFTTLAALWLFKQAKTDLVLLEVGLGGRLDAVNIVEPDVSVVTSVGLDHQDWLGDTREAIAAEKCGIARHGKPLVYGELDRPDNLEALIGQLGAKGVLAGRDFSINEGRLWLVDGQRLDWPAQVQLGVDNLATAAQALCLAGLRFESEEVAAVADLSLFGRCEWIRHEGRDCWLDVGHNVPAVQRFLSLLPACEGQRHLVFGMMADKPIDEVMALWADQPVYWYLAAPDVPRAASVARLAEALPGGQPATRFATVADAVKAALETARAEDQVIIFGSFYTVAEARAGLVETGGVQGE